jgi:hypothetical protein
LSLRMDKLDKVVELSNGGKKARCPACAEGGQDRKGQHLRIAADGKFGCCVFPGDAEHRRRIFALAGDFGPKEIRVRVAAFTERAPVQTGIIGKIASVAIEEPTEESADGSDGGTELQTQFAEIRTGRTAESESAESDDEQSRTARTESLLLTRNAKNDHSYTKLIEFADPVRSVRVEVRPPNDQPTTVAPLPYLLSDGALRIPFNSPERYHWWKEGGQSIRETLAELCQPPSVNNLPNPDEANY